MLLLRALFLNYSLLRRGYVFIIFTIIFKFGVNAQLANYVKNGSFEDVYNCIQDNSPKVKYWNDLDSVNSAAPYCNGCLGNSPYNGFGFQFPKLGSGYIIADFLTNISDPITRTYVRNRLKTKLESNKNYCVKFYVNIGNNSSYGIDGFGAYFGDNSLDTISYAHVPLTYLTPQVQNQNGNIITDTLNWTAVTGTFTAIGNEKYMVIGNFKSDAATNKLLINPTFTPGIFCTVSIDDVSCIPIDLPAYAGPNVSVIPGQSVYIGRPADVGIDEACTWYKLPSSSPVATAAGIWVSPAQTSTYVVEQQIWCGTVKYDTVVVYMNPVGLSTSSRLESEIRIFPNPANDLLQLEILNDDLFQQFKTVVIYNSTGKVIHEKILESGEKEISIQTEDFPSGFYLLQLSGANEIINKRFVVSR